MSVRRLAVVAFVTAFVACDLNPQPLPPFVPENQAGAGGTDGSAGFGSQDPGRKTDEEPAPSTPDAGSLPDASAVGGDAGDDGDGGDGDGGDDAGVEDAGDAETS